MRTLLRVLPFLLLTLDCLAQEAPADSMAHYKLESVVVTATRTPKDIEDVAVPTRILSAQELQSRGILRLTDALAELPGLTVNFDHGAGIQVQGFDADYTLILIDGEPVIGRTAGTLDLERLTVAGIERIEVVYGPSSSLYGSEALAGVINIITQKASAPLAATFSSRYGTHQTTDFAASLTASSDRAGIKALFNRYSSSGYDLNPDTFGSTTPSFVDYTADVRAHWDIEDRTKITLGGRLAWQDQDADFALINTPDPYKQTENQIDWNLHSELSLRFSSQIETIVTLYSATFSTETEQRNQVDQTQLFFDSIDQFYNKAEIQTNAYWSANHLTVAGAGFIEESLNGERYDGFKPNASSQFIYIQHEWLPSPSLDINVSGRFDAHESYASRLSPKLSLLYRPSSRLRFRFSAGSGFKAPAFRQLFLNFTNAAAGYTVLGSTQLESGIDRLNNEGAIDDVFIDPTNLQEIQAERSIAFNAGASINVLPNTDLTVGVFHNNVRDLIETQPVAQKSNGSFVYSYFNLNRVYTRGINLELSTSPLQWLKFSSGYQFLQARDRDVVDAINEGRVFGRTLNNRDYVISLTDYEGLLGRSPHSGTIRTVFTSPKQSISADIRGIWRSRYGYRDIDGNTIANLDEEFVPGYIVWNSTITKNWSIRSRRTLTAQFGIRNLFDVTKPSLIPSLPGRTFYTSLQLSL